MTPPVPTAYRLFFSGESFSGEQLEQLERAFFCNIILANGTFKTTNHRRLDDLNALLRGQLPPERPLRVMDVAVSSGVSTAEWAADLQDHGIAHEMTAGDLMVDAFLITVRPNLRVLIDKAGHLLQLDVRGTAIRTPFRKRHLARYGLSILAAKAAAAMFKPTLRELSRRKPGSGSLQKWGMGCEPLKLVSSSLRKFPDISIVEDDILLNTAYARCFNVVRAANILNRVYFSDAILTAMLSNLRGRLMPHGLLVICRTNEQQVNNATIFRLSEHGTFEVAARLNAGSEIEDLALSLPAG
jgi:hypothetical protein